MTDGHSREAEESVRSPETNARERNLRTRIASVLLTHRHSAGKCLCQGLRESNTSGEHAQHVAEVLMRDIPELQARCDCQGKNWTRDD